MTTPRTVVVGIDGSEVANTALVFAADEARRRGARLIVAHAGDVSHLARPETEVRPFAEILCQEAVATVAAVDPQLDCRVVLRAAAPAELLVELAASAELLVVGTHRMGRLRGWVLGSVSQYVAAHARCPVVTISAPPDHDDGAIVLGVSATPGGIAALRFACEEARVRGVPVRAIRSIISEDWALSAPGREMVLGSDILHDAAQAELDRVLAEAKESYPDVSVDGETSNTSPFSALLDAADGASMLVIGSRRGQSSPLPHLGPVAAWLLHQATCPLAVVGHRDA